MSLICATNLEEDEVKFESQRLISKSRSVPWRLTFISVIDIIFSQEDFGSVFLESSFHLEQCLRFLHTTRHLILHDDSRNT